MPYRIIANVVKEKWIDPDRVRVCLLEVGRGEGDGNIEIQRPDHCVVTVRTAERTGI